jgi:hypothetical protein
VTPSELSARTTHILESGLGQAGSTNVVDLDGDGKMELVVSGYENNVVYAYHRK